MTKSGICLSLIYANLKGIEPCIFKQYIPLWSCTKVQTETEVFIYINIHKVGCYNVKLAIFLSKQLS